MLLCKSLNSPLLPLHSSSFSTFFIPQHNCSVPKHRNFTPLTLTFPYNFTIWPSTHIGFSSRNAVPDDAQSTHLLSEQKNGDFKENEELELHNKPSPLPVSDEPSVELGTAVKKPNKEEALAPFLKFFKPKGSGDEETKDDVQLEMPDVGDTGEEKEEVKKVGVEFYKPKPGDFVLGVVVSGNENILDVNIGSESFGSMLTKEVLPLYDKDMDYLLCDLDKDREEFVARGKVGIVKHDNALSKGALPGRPILNAGTLLFAEVLGIALSGRPVLSCRQLFRRYAWRRVRQLKQIEEPIEVKITEWSTDGLITRIEGIRALLPKGNLIKKINSFTELKAKVGCRIYVLITRMNEAKNDIILSERRAWETLYLHEGTLFDGTVKRFLPFGAEIQISGTDRSGLLHMSKISHGKFSSVHNLLVLGEKVKVLLLKQVGRKILFSTADLESEPGLFISNKEKVFSEAEEMAKKYRKRLPVKRVASGKLNLEGLSANDLPFDNEATMYANWKWFKFERDNEPN